VQPLPRVAGVPALPESGPPDPGAAGHLHRSRVPPPRRILRFRAHGPLPPGRPIVRVQRRPLLPTPSPCQASQRVAVVAAQPGRICLVNAARAQLLDRARSLPGLTRGAPRLPASGALAGRLGALAGRLGALAGRPGALAGRLGARHTGAAAGLAGVSPPALTGGPGQSSAWPRTQVTVPPATQIVPSSSRETCTRPARPSAVPWLTT